MTAVGIDLGTTISSVARQTPDGRVQLAGLRDGSPRLRSVVTFDDGRVVVGEEAQTLAPLDPDSSFAFFKRRMGTDWEVPHDDRIWTAPQLSAEILKALVADAITDLGERPQQAVVTIPAYFGDDARRATQEAASLAGLDIAELVHEPTAACLAHEPDPDATLTQLVYDLGGGTFDVSVVRFSPGGAEVLATAGDDQLGGKDWDDVLLGLIADRIESEYGVDLRDDQQLVTDLLERTRDAKHSLSRLQRTAVSVPVSGSMRRIEVTRSEFDAVASSLFTRTEAVVERVLDDIGGRSGLDAVLLVGGSSRMPRCRDALVASTGLEPRSGVDPDAAVVTGAAITAGRIVGAGRSTGLGRRRTVRDATAHALGLVVVSADGNRYVNQTMIARNAPIPARETRPAELAVGRDDTGVLDVYMLQGEAERPLDTSPLGRWTFDGVPGDRSGTVQVDVAYAYDEDGVCHVSASVGGTELPAPRIDRDDRDVRWTEEDPSAHNVPDLSVALVIDVSGSMHGGKLDEAKRACEGFIDVLEEAGAADRICLVPFGDVARLAAPLGASPGEVRQAVRALRTEGWNDFVGGLRIAWNQLSQGQGRRVIVFLTDGHATSQEEIDTIRARDAIVDGNGEIIVRGVRGADEAFLRKLDSGSELLRSGEVVDGFRGIAQQLSGGGGAMRRLGRS